jgi:hypothetical protein
VGCFYPIFQFYVSVAASQKIDFDTLKMEKRHFSWDEKKIGLCGVPLHPKAMRVSDMASF